MPFCPKCKYEYKEGIKVCSDCGVELVASLTDLKVPVLVRDEDTINEAYDFLVTNGVDYADKCESDSGEGSFAILVPEDKTKEVVGMLNVYYREVHTATEEELEIAKEKAEAAMVNSRYVDTKDRAENYKSGAGVLIGVGIIGIVVLVLVNTGIIKLPLPTTTKTLMNIVMGALFAIFVGVGINSYINYKKYKNLAVGEDSLEDQINEWADNELDVNELTASENENDSEELKFFSRTELLRSKLEERFPDLESSFREHIVEDLYDRIFGCE